MRDDIGMRPSPVNHNAIDMTENRPSTCLVGYAALGTCCKLRQCRKNGFIAKLVKQANENSHLSGTVKRGIAICRRGQ